MSTNPRPGPQNTSPLDLPRPHLPRPRETRDIRSAYDIAVIDVDNLAIGPDHKVRRVRAANALAAVYRRTRTAQVNLAVVSRSVSHALGDSLVFDFPDWIVRFADTGRDAADRELIAFVETHLRTRPGAQVAVASGDGIFACLPGLPGIGAVEVVVPQGHHGVARVLRPLVRPATRDRHGLAA